MNHQYEVGIYEKAFPEGLPFPEMLSVAKDSGYDFYEINIDRTDYRISRLYDESFVPGLERAVRQSGFPVRSLGLSALSTYTLGNEDASVAEKAVDIFQRAVLFAERLGIRMIQIPGCDVPKEGVSTENTNRRFYDNVRRMTEFASSHGVPVGVENMENDYMNSVGKTMKLISAADSPYLQLYPDSGNISNAFSQDMDAIKTDMDKGKGHYLAFHFKESKPGRFGGLYYGEGCVDFAPIAKKAYALGARRFAMEYWYTGNPAWKEDLRKARLLCDSWITE